MALSGEALPILSPEPCSGFSWVAGPSVDSLEVLVWRWVGGDKHLSLKSLGSCDPSRVPLDAQALGLCSVRAEPSSTFCALAPGLRVAECRGIFGKQCWLWTIVSGIRCCTMARNAVGQSTWITFCPPWLRSQCTVSPGLKK